MKFIKGVFYRHKRTKSTILIVDTTEVDKRIFSEYEEIKNDVSKNCKEKNI